MREIKFRAWDNVNKVMQYSDIIWGDYDFPALSELNYGDNIYNLSNLMQYTGLLDKSGKEIYEGDIVIASKMPYYWEFVKSVNKGLVVYNNHTASYRIKIDNYHSSTIGESDTVKFNPVSKYEVIGNIYENPELLDK